MKFKDAIPKMQSMPNGDYFIPTNPPSYHYAKIWKVEDKDGEYFCSSGCTALILRPSFLELEGEIISADPKVLTESELVGKIMALNEYGCHTAFSRQWLSDVIDICQKNGRLSMWLDFRKIYEKLATPETVKQTHNQKYLFTTAIDELNPNKDNS